MVMKRPSQAGEILQGTLDLLVLNTFTCAAEFTQVAAIEALRDTTNAVDAMVAEYKLRRDLFVQSLGKIPGFRCHSPEGAWFKQRAEEAGFHQAVQERDSGEPIAGSKPPRNN